MTYLVTRAHGLSTHLLSEGDYQLLLKAKDVDAAADFLLKGDYAQAVEGARAASPGASGLARAAFSVLSSRCYGLLDYAPGGGRALLEAYLACFLFEDLKRALRAKAAGTGVDAGGLIPVPRGQDTVGLREVVDAQTMEEAGAYLEKRGIGGVAAYIGAPGARCRVSAAEAALDRAYFRRLISLLHGVPDLGAVKDALVTEADLAGVVAIADLRSRGLSRDAIRAVAFEPVSLSRGQTSALLDSSMDSFPEAVARTRFGGLAEAFRESLAPGGSASLDHLSKSELQKRARAAATRTADSFAYVFGYVRRARAEADNIVSLATGKELGMGEDEISRALCV